MRRIASTIRRVAGSDLAQDICAGLVVTAFIIAATYGSAGIIMMVEASRAGQ